MSYSAKVIATRVPGKHLESFKSKSVNHAPWLPDCFVKFLADCCQHPNQMRRARAFFYWQSAIGGVRFSDAQHVVNMQAIGTGVGACIVMTASRFKTSSGPRVVEEKYIIPQVDHLGRSVLPAMEALRAQMRKGEFLLAGADKATDVESPLRSYNGVVQPMTYSKSCECLRAFAAEWQRWLPTDHEYKHLAVDRITMHSFRGWLDTLARQARFRKEDIETLLHWSDGKMYRRYDRNPMVLELVLRQQLLGLLASDWRSAGLGDDARPPPALESLTVVQPATTRF